MKVFITISNSCLGPTPKLCSEDQVYEGKVSKPFNHQLEEKLNRRIDGKLYYAEKSIYDIYDFMGSYTK